jgi:hypothetical protein
MSETKVKDSGKTPCFFCAKLIPTEAKRCNECSAYQRGWRRKLPLASTVTMVATAGALLGAIATFTPFAITQWTNFVNRHSSTSIAFAGVDADPDSNLVVIRAHLWNTGRKPSLVRSYHLKLDTIHVEDVTLLATSDDTHDVKSIIPAGGEVTAILLVRGLRALVKNAGSEERYSRQEILDALPTAKLTLEAVVEESNDDVATRGRSFEAELLNDVILRRFPN